MNIKTIPQSSNPNTPPVETSLDDNEVQICLMELIQSFNSLILATTDPSGVPEASYAPFILGEDNCFYVYVSDLARHTAHLKRGATVSILLIEDEVEAANVFGRRRLTLHCTPTEIMRGTEGFDATMCRFCDQFGSTAERLATMQDFHLFALKPAAGRLVLGFGAAFRTQGLTVVNHLKGKHRPSS